MRILSIETSCDETAIALLEMEGKPNKPEIKVLGNALLSQMHLHEQYGGVYPNLAKREHIKNLPILLEKVLSESGIKHQESENIDYIAVTEGPGLEPALWTGITFAQDLSKKWGKPIVPVNHMEGHIYSVLFENKKTFELPALALLVSGGHTELVLVKDFGQYEILGSTLDDAVGESFDKVARMLGLPYPGGPEISRLALEARAKNIEADFHFPSPMIHSKDLNFSYSGLKTAVLYKLKALGEIDDTARARLARAFEDAAVEVLVAKTRKALETHDVRALIVAGGVSANAYLRKRLEGLMQEFGEISLRFPTPLLTTDNALMIGIAAFVKLTRIGSKATSSALEIQAQGNLSLVSWG